MEWMTDVRLWFVARLSLLYYLPLMVCAVFYILRTLNEVTTDLQRRARQGKLYSPDLTVGRIVWRLICTITPGLNIIAAVLLVLEKMMRWGDWLVRSLDFAVVPRRKEEVSKGVQSTSAVDSK